MSPRGRPRSSGAEYARAVDVRTEGQSDSVAVRALHRAAFAVHGHVVANLVDELRAAVTSGEGLSLVAEERGEVVGHVMFTPSLLDAPRRLVPVQVLSPLGVVPWRLRRGVREPRRGGNPRR
jgi:putative acetyltransferase